MRKPKDIESRISFPCFFCKRSFQCGPHRYDGRRYPAWDMNICDSCYGANWDGFLATNRLVEHLKSRSVSFQYNDKGHILRPS